VAYPDEVNRVWLAFVLAASVACAPTPADDEATFLRDVQTFRAAKDQAFLQPDSPVPADKRQALLPLAYYPPAATYRVPAVLQVSTERVTIEMPTSTGQRRNMRHVGTLEFSVRGEPLSLGAFVEEGSADLNRLFVPFMDLTSGSETYPAGRYLDLDRTRTGIYLIDFNRAYNPYCYYNPTYDCPYPPRANRLQVPIRAGEKVK
jgi:uncharacterized protein